ncbi:MAG: alpha/beta hydrolase [Elusimicrobia bacterium]|nr:alpha/beta hydrolase [Elusimicrobiota bacterium]
MSRPRSIARVLLVAVFLTSCSPTRFFYYPNNVLYVDPAHLKLKYEMRWFKSLNGKKLFALYFPTDQAPKGIVVHFHGNYGNVSNHFIGSSFLVHQGFDVLVFDYEGYGGSEGHPKPKRTIEDGVAALRYAKDIDRGPPGSVVVLAQSLGGAIAIPAMVKEPIAKAAVIQAAFTSYRGIARDVLKRSAWTWILYPIAPWFIGTANDPVRFVGKLPDIPLLFIHGDKDPVIPIRMTKELFDKAKEPKELWIVPGAGHNDLRQQAGDAYDERVGDFFTKALTSKG